MATQPLFPSKHIEQESRYKPTSTIVQFPGASSRNTYNLIISASQMDISDATRIEIEAFFLEHQKLWPELMVTASKDLRKWIANDEEAEVIIEAFTQLLSNLVKEISPLSWTSPWKSGLVRILRTLQSVPEGIEKVDNPKIGREKWWNILVDKLTQLAEELPKPRSYQSDAMKLLETPQLGLFPSTDKQAH